MPRISTDNYDTVASWNGSQDLFVVEQPDGTKVATPAMVKQYVLGNSIDDIYSVMGQNGAKNLIPYPYYEKTHVDNGITWTDNGDGTVTANGTSTAASYFILSNRTLKTDMADSLIEGKRYILTGCPTGGSNQTYDIFINETYNSAEVGIAFDYGNGATFTLNHKTETNYGIGIRIRSGQTVSNLTFKPMLRIASDTDNTYQPYAKTNKELTEVIGDLSQTGLTGDSVAEQLGTAGGQIAEIKTALGNLKIAVFTQTFSNLNIGAAWGSLYVSPELTFDISSLGLQSAPKSVSLEVKATSAPTVMTVINNFNASSIKFFIAMPVSYPNVTVDISVLVVYARE